MFMADLPSADFRRLLELVTSLLNTGEMYLPWEVLGTELGEVIPYHRALLAVSHTWGDAPSQDFPPPCRMQAGPAFDEYDVPLDRHLLMCRDRATADRVTCVAERLDDPALWPDEPTRDLVFTQLPASRQHAWPLPAPPDEWHLIVLCRTAAAFGAGDLQMAKALVPPLAALVSQQRQLMRPSAQQPALSETLAFENEHLLTPHELAVLTLLGDTLTAAAIARKLGISPRTVHKHLESIYRKLGTRDRLATILRAQSAGLLPVHAAAARTAVS
jgi:DNA-binding CsgD family transcriptional regulator